MAGGLPPLPPSYARGLELIDAAHSEDPNKMDGPDGPGSLACELRYARNMTKWLEARCPSASPELQLACRAQHFKRWQLPRSSFPMTRPGYLTWRAKQKSQAAADVASLLASPSIAPPLSREARDRVAALVRKDGLLSAHGDAETQALEDVACLVFLDHQLDDFEAKAHIDEDKMVVILRKTWAKMSQPGRQLALAMDLSDRARTLIGKALEAAP
ncbi:Uncharacterized protein TCAP_07569 [Tolypocladium capitatum]|uniref:Glutamyl-tRNA synthetase n=1 Tax=Tolypocladium capitatum TaxID=45235 RepID=A0A2K3PSQ5_9HYPO|nr:Uncharacterized protein TCAP_07569 [Tolypocladium capitatum]